MTPADTLLELAATVDGWPPSPRPAIVLDVLTDLDRLAARLGQMVSIESPRSLADEARALHTIAAGFRGSAPDLEALEAAERVALRTLAAIHRLAALAAAAKEKRR